GGRVAGLLRPAVRGRQPVPWWSGPRWCSAAGRGPAPGPDVRPSRSPPLPYHGAGVSILGFSSGAGRFTGSGSGPAMPGRSGGAAVAVEEQPRDLFDDFVGGESAFGVVPAVCPARGAEQGRRGDGWVAVEQFPGGHAFGVEALHDRC